jgi:hypothetical protein
VLMNSRLLDLTYVGPQRRRPARDRQAQKYAPLARRVKVVELNAQGSPGSPFGCRAPAIAHESQRLPSHGFVTE